MLVVTPSTLMNRAALETRNVPKRMLGRIAVIPKRGATFGLIARLLFETQILRYLLPLVPFVIAMLIWPRLALPIAQAPVPMVLIIALVEMKVLAITPEARKKLADDDEIARVLDALRFNATQILTRIAAEIGMQHGELLLVVEQSELARITPLTLVSVQTSEPSATVIDLAPEHRRLIAETLFDDDLSETALHRITLARNENLHSIALDTSSVSAHARMAAAMPAPAAV